ncbi:MAG: hypothetical protein ACLFR7_03945 [Opitutales bacterium]
MDGITAAITNQGAERQLGQLRTYATMVREAHSSSTAVVELLDAAKAAESPDNDPQSGNEQSPRPGQLLNIVA